MSQNCMWCGHAEETHSAIFGGCQHVAPDAFVTWCVCREYQAPPPDPSLRRLIGAAVRFCWHWTLAKIGGRFEGWQR